MKNLLIACFTIILIANGCKKDIKTSGIFDKNISNNSLDNEDDLNTSDTNNNEIVEINSPKKVENLVEDIDLVKFVCEDLLPGIRINKLYEIDGVIKAFGEYEIETFENAKIDYEGMKGEKLRILRYKNYDMVIYVIETGREIFGYLRLHSDFKNKYINYDDDIDYIINRYGNKVKKWSEKMYTISPSAMNDINYFSGITLIVNDNKIKQIQINLGEI